MKTTRLRKLVRGAILLLVLTGWFATPRLFRRWAESVALAASMTFVVNSAADTDDGLCSSAPGGCTFREAIKAANVNLGVDTINFNIPGAGVKTIHLASNLPEITSSVVIDGYTQGIAHPNTLAVGNDAVLLIELDVSTVSLAQPLSSFGLKITGSGCIVTGLVINRFDSAGIFLFGGANGNFIEGNFIGTNATGDSMFPGFFGSGVTIGSQNNTIGGNNPAARNLLSGNFVGVQIGLSNAIGNQVRNNYIGSDKSGNTALGNKLDGIRIIGGATNNTIGGTLPTLANLIAYNQRSGVNVDQTSTGNAILGNSIHSNSALGIDLGPDGVTANDVSDGDTGANNLQNFPVLTSATSTSTTTTIKSSLNSTPNTQFRLEFFSSPSCDPSGNGEGKKLIHSSTVMTVGDNFFLSFPVPNAQLDGPFITATATDSSNNTSEFSNCIPVVTSTLVVNSTADADDGACTVAAGGCTLREAIAAANMDQGLDKITFNIPGSGVQTISPTSALPDITGPVIIDGYTQPGASPNTLADGDNAVLTIELNGTNAGPVSGLVLEGGMSVVRGLAINRFLGAGIAVRDNGDNVIAGNFIGTDPTGISDLGNFTGLDIRNVSGNRIGGITPSDRNIISGNTLRGILFLNAGATGNLVQGNYIGTNAAGTAAIGNIRGVDLDNAPLNTIGGNTVGARNIISGNTIGVVIEELNAHNNRVQGNFIGTDVSGNSALGNTMAGVNIGMLGSPSGNTIGGFGLDEGNVIAFNGGDGVIVNLGIENAIVENSIHSNGGLGIDLAPDGVTPNDTGDADTGPNNLQNFPVLTSATANGSFVKVEGTLSSVPNKQLNVSFFSSSSCDPSGNGEGEKRLSGIVVTADVNGDVTFSASLDAAAGGRFITATATDQNGNTSEFSNCVQAPFLSSIQFGTPSMSVVEDCTEVVFTVSRIGDTSTAASVDYATQSGTALDRTDFTTAVGTLQFAPGETAMSFTVLISEDSFVEGIETATLTLNNAVGAGLGIPTTATLQITDDQPEQSNNPVDSPEQFVCQHYHDFLNREHDTAGLNFWTNEIESCGSNAQCREVKRINVSAAFFLSIEFQETSGSVIRTQRAAFGKKSDTAATRLTYLRFLRDARQVGKGVVVGDPGWQQKLEDNKQAYAEQIVTSSQFVMQYPLSQSADTYVDTLFASAAVVPTAGERQDAINAFAAGGTSGRTAALRIVSDSQTLRTAEFKSAFVLLQYFGYLRRNPTDAPDNNDNGYQFWLAKLNAFNGDFAKAEMVKAFIVSLEYRSRFGEP
jgi:CSLREA domain-containing protein